MDSENLKCCGNCRQGFLLEQGFRCSLVFKDGIKPWNYCDDWVNDCYRLEMRYEIYKEE
jgi:hypothetical protein